MDSVDHVVVLMLENRSFDHVLGFLYDETDIGDVNYAGAQPEDGKPKFYGLAFSSDGSEQGVERSGEWLTSKHFANETKGGAKFHARARPTGYYDNMDNSDKEKLEMFSNDAVWPPCGPGEEQNPHVEAQLYGSNPADWSKDPDMVGFVNDYARVRRGKKKDDKEDGDEDEKDDEYDTKGGDVMTGLAADTIPTLRYLAKNYAVCDRWFSAVPTQTWANRLFAFCGTSHGVVNNPPVRKTMAHLNTYPVRSVLSHMDEWHHGEDHQAYLAGTETPTNIKDNDNWKWHVYTHVKKLDMSYMLFGNVFDPKKDSAHERYREFEKLKADATNGALASYNFIEPLYLPIKKDGKLIPHNDQHPSEMDARLNDVVIRPPVWEADRLVLDLYETLFGANAKNPDKTLLIITYDEHGGTYDHVAPPSATPPDMQPDKNSDVFHFQRLGVRVPAIFVSPRIKKHTILRAPQGKEFDHTSIIKSLRMRWKVDDEETPPMTRRDRAAPDFWPVLNTTDDPGTPDQRIGEIANLRAKHDYLDGLLKKKRKSGGIIAKLSDKVKEIITGCLLGRASKFATMIPARIFLRAHHSGFVASTEDEILQAAIDELKGAVNTQASIPTGLYSNAVAAPMKSEPGAMLASHWGSSQDQSVAKVPAFQPPTAHVPKKPKVPAFHAPSSQPTNVPDFQPPGARAPTTTTALSAPAVQGSDNIDFVVGDATITFTADEWRDILNTDQ